jgi:hypothetical protein
MKKQNEKTKQIENDQLITILRRPSGLYALINRPKYRFSVSLYFKDDNNSFEELDQFFECIEVSLDKVSIRVFPEKQNFLQDWRHVCETRKLTESLCTVLMRLLLNTQEAPNSDSVQPSPYQFDPIAFLFNSNDRNRMLAGMLTDWKSGSDPYWNYNFPGTQRISKLPKNFNLHILPLLKKEAASAITDWIWLYRSLELDRKTNLLHIISRMLKLGKEYLVRAWCKKLLPCLPNRRAIASTLILHSRVYESDPTKFNENILADFFALTSKKNVTSRLYYFFHAIRKGLSVDYIFDGFRLSNKYCTEHQFMWFNRCKSFSYDKVVQLTNYVRRSYPRESDLPMHLWKEWRIKNGFGKIMSDPIFFKLGSKVAYHLAQFIVDYLYFFADAKNAPIFLKLATSALPKIFSILQFEVPQKYRVKFCKGLSSLGWGRTNIDDCSQNIIPLSKALQRICKRPFNREDHPFELLLVFVKNSKALWPAFLSASDSSFLCLEKSCRSRNDIDLIVRGSRVLLKMMPLFTIKCFRLFPGKLFEVAKLLGVFSYPDRISIVKQFRGSPECSQKFRNLDLFQIAERIRQHLRPEISNPLPKILSKYLKGEYRLTPARLKRYRRVLFENLNLTRLNILEHSIRQTLTKSYPAANISGLDHAMQIVRLIRKNRRQLKRFLHSYITGNRLYIAHHPRTVHWMRSHSMIDFEKWQKGIALTKEVEGFGLIRISLEADPFEVLKMGTYAGSCLGIGGVNAFSAAAVMLDINKQVAYARNLQGNVIARQLLAISEEDKLVCFTVYPVGINKSIKELFRKYDRRLAKNLNLELSVSRSQYHIQNILSQGWYDDHGWNLKD